MAEILSEFGHLVGLAGGNNIQATTMPTYSSVPLGTIVQYIGTTTADYINGYFYKATATGWEQHDTQPASNADNSITAFKESSPALAAHAVDEYIRYNNVTYIVTAAIAIGDTLTVGTNIAVPTLDEGTVIYTPETGGGINGVVDVLVDGQTVVDENGEAHINTPNAGGIGYDNTESELEATNTQDAIDEVVDIVADKVDKVAGKGLSTNDYDNTDKAKVNKIDETTTSASGNPISISGLKSNQLAINPVITLEPIQAGSGDPSPSNVRAISGYDKIEVLSCGKNLFNTNGNISLERMSNNNGTFTNTSTDSKDHFAFSVVTTDFNDNTITYNSRAISSTGVHAISISLGNQVARKLHIKHNGTNADLGLWYSVALTGDITVSLNVTAYNPSSVGGLSFKDVQIEQGSWGSTFEPYTGNQIQLTLGQTIYGGTLDVEKGILTVHRGYKSWKWSDGTGSTNFTNTQRRVFEIGTEYTYAGSKWLTNVTNTYLYDAGADVVHYYYEMSTFVLFMPLNTDGNTEIQLVYPLATPYTIQLTPHEISLLKDYAYVSTNGTNMQFSYKNGEMASLGDVAQLGQTVNELGDRTPIIINRKEFFTSAAEISYTGISIPVEFGKIYVFSVRLMYQNSQPYHVSVSEVNDAVQSWRIIADADGCYVSFVYSPADNNVNNLYIWATYSNAAENHILIRGLIYPMN